MAQASNFTDYPKGPSKVKGDYLWQPCLVKGTNFEGTVSSITAHSSSKGDAVTATLRNRVVYVER